MPRMAERGVGVDGNKMEREKYAPQHAPHFPSYIRTDSPVLLTLTSQGECATIMASPAVGQGWGPGVLAPPPHPEAKGKPGHSCSQDLPTWGQGGAETWFPGGL